jgi:L-iditol 2-dehydrogenase
MRAVVLDGPRSLVLTEVPEPERIGDRSVLVRIGAVGVCGSDMLRFGRGKAYHYPLVLGHEFSAVVEEVPPGSSLRPGDRVAVFPLLPRGDDPMSAIGEYALSSNYDYFGSRRDGGLEDRLWVPEANLFRVPAETPLTHAAMVEPAGVALHAMRKVDIPAHATALVIGAGPIGALAAQWLRILGCSRVIVADVDDQKLDLMSSMGFETIDARKGTVEEVGKTTDGRGPHIVVEATGSPVALVQGIQAAAVLGQVVLLGDLNGDLLLEQHVVSSILRRELRLLGTWNAKITPVGHSDWDMVIHHLADLHLDELISHVRPMAEAPETFDQLLNREIWYSKVLFQVAPDAAAEVREP